MRRMETETLRRLIEWHREYRQEWDALPTEYSLAGIVPRGKSRRLGVFKVGAVKAYLGVQDVDPAKPGWEAVGTRTTRFFVSIFVSGQVVTLRTFPTIPEGLNFLLEFLQTPRS